MPQVLNYTLVLDELLRGDVWRLMPSRILKVLPLVDHDSLAIAPDFWGLRVFVESQGFGDSENWAYRIFLTGEEFPEGYEYVDSFETGGNTLHLYRSKDQHN